MKRVVALLAAVLSIPAIAADEPPARDWAAALRTDARFFHDDVAANHPGPYNNADPGFAARNDRALATALARADRVTGFAGYLYAMRGYAASFDDGHVGFGATARDARLSLRWPGFLTGYSGDETVRVATTATEAMVRTGDRLVSCDGVPADQLSETRLAPFSGRWMLASQRRRAGRRLFLDDGNPFIPPIRSCVFDRGGRPLTVTLAWQTLTSDEADRRLAAVDRRERPPIGARVLADGTRWYTMSDFDGDPGSDAGKALPGMIAAMRADRMRLSAAPAIVLDLRGNNGGSSDWSRQVAEILWGADAVRRAEKGSDYVEWRASPANLAFMRQTRDARLDLLSPEAKSWFDRTIAGLESGIATRRPLWREPAEFEAATAPQAVPPPLRGRIWIVTDEGCGSACLDAADLWGKLGAKQVGRETSADTLYMDIRQDALPSGLGQVAVPMKVYRHRPRGSNEPLKPVHAFAGDITDTPALETWVAILR